MERLGGGKRRLVFRRASVSQPSVAGWLAGLLGLAMLVGLTGVVHPARAGAEYRPMTEESRSTRDVTGRVVDERGQPVPGVTVLAVHGPEEDEQQRTARTGADGSFAFPGLDDGYWSFSVDDSRYAWMWEREQPIAVPAMPEILPVTIIVYDPRTMEGVVVDETGRHVPGVRLIYLTGRLSENTEPFRGHFSRDLLVAVTDESGRFSLSRLRPGEIHLTLEHPDYAPKTVDDWVAVDGVEKRLTIERGLTLRGRVVHEGASVSGVELRSKMNVSGRPIIDWRGTSDERGEFEIPRIPSEEPDGKGRWTPVRVEDTVWTSAQYAIYQTKRDELPFIEIEVWRKEEDEPRWRPRVEVGKRLAYHGDGPPPENPGTIRVQIVPPDEGWVDISPAKSGAGWRCESSDVVRGRVSFENVPYGEYKISFWSRTADGIGRTPVTVMIREGETVEVVLKPEEGGIGGAVRSGSTPVDRGHVSWESISQTAPMQGGASVGTGGRYRIEGLLPRQYELSYSDATRSMSHKFIFDHTGSETTFDIDLPSGRIEGRLVGIEPKPPPENAEEVFLSSRFRDTIYIRPRNQTPLRSKGIVGARVFADTDGRFIAEHLSPGHYTITGYGTRARAYVESPDSVVKVELKLPVDPGIIEGSIRGPIRSSDSFRSATVAAYAKDELGYDFDAVRYAYGVDKTRVYRLEELPPGTYGVLLSAVFSGIAPQIWIPDVEVKAGFLRQLDIEIPENRVVFVRAAKKSHTSRYSPVRLETWRMRMPSGDWLPAYLFLGSEVVGRFALPLGRYAIEAEYRDGEIVRQDVVVEPGEGEQEIVLERR